MADGEHEDDEALVLEAANEAEVADAIAPQPRLVGDQRLAEAARIVVGGDALAQIPADGQLHGAIELAELLGGVEIELNRPGQARAPAPPASPAGLPVPGAPARD